KKFHKQSETKDECPKDYHKVGTRCLQFITDGNYKETFGDAQFKCQARNARLVTILLPEVLTIFIRTNYPGVNFWVGATKDENKGAWRWTNGEEIKSNTYYEILKYNLGIGHNCLAWISSKNSFSVHRCGEKLQYICEAVVQDCKDKDSLCYKWKRNCNTDKWVTKTCPKSCGKCASAKSYCTPHPDCVFPFILNKRRHSKCTKKGKGLFLCSTTKNPDFQSANWHKCTGVC
ncbi:unnamed protein product, partial [Meganyctiphanes norvegica]